MNNKGGSELIKALEKAQMNNWLLFYPSIIALLMMCYSYSRGATFDMCVTVGIFTSLVQYSIYIVLFVLLPETYMIGSVAREKYLEAMQKPSDEPDLLVPEDESPKDMTREEMIDQLNEVYKQMSDEKRQRILQLATVYIFILNGLEDCTSDGPKNSPYHLCYSSAELGWLAMSQRLCNDPDYEYEKEMFDADTTHPYLVQISNEEDITDPKLKQLIRWSFNYGAQMRVDYGTLSNYADSVLAGNFFVVKVFE